MKKKPIPLGWKEKSLRSIVNSTQLGGNYDNFAQETGNVPLIKMGNLDRGFIKLDRIEYVSANQKVSPKDILKKNDLLLNTRNTLDLVGKVALWREELSLAAFNSNLMRIEFDPESIFSNEFANILFNSRDGLKQLRHIAIGTTSVGAIYWRDLALTKWRLPPLAEQQHIIRVLSVWDFAINQTEQLLFANHRRKKALMQLLLTGKQRFREFVASAKLIQTKYGKFPADWEYLHIGKVASEASERDVNSSFPVLSCTKHNGLVESLKYFDRQVFAEDRSSYKVVRQGCFAYATNHIEEGSIGLQDFLPAGSVSPIYTVFKTSRKVHAPFLYALLKTDLFLHIFRAATSASVDRRGSLRWKDFALLRISLPSLPEQQKIAAVLNTADEEINQLKAQLAALRRQKQGLMQILLTGKARVNAEAKVLKREERTSVGSRS